MIIWSESDTVEEKVAMGSIIGKNVVGSGCEEFRARSVIDGNPLAVALLPLGDRVVQAASLDWDASGGPCSVPFGLTRVTVPDVHAINLGGASYDPVRQITVMPDGTPFIDAPSMKSTLYCSTTTTEDMQSWPDTVADGTD